MVSILMVLFIMPSAVLAEELAAEHTLTVTATVPPSLLIIVDEDLIIQKITSNTPHQVQPTVRLHSLTGKELPYYQMVKNQYIKLADKYDFSRAGQLYERHPGFTFNLLKAFYSGNFLSSRSMSL